MIDRLSIHGPTLASLLHSCYTGQRMCDGVLFGTIQHLTTTQAHDDAEARETVETVAHISGAICCCSTCSFYDALGDVDDAKLTDIVAAAPGQPIGWFSYRPGTQQHPSLREALVTASLQRWLAQQQQHQGGAMHASTGQQQQQQQQQRHPSSTSRAGASTSSSSDGSAAAAGRDVSDARRLPPVVFGVVGSGGDHGGATITLQYRMFQPLPAPSSSPAASPTDRPGSSRVSLQPLQLQTLNLGRSLGHHDTSSSNGSSSMRFDAATFADALGAGPPAEAQQLLHQLEAAAAAQQVGAIEGVHGTLLRRLEALAAEAGAQLAEVDALRQQRDALLAGLSL